MNDADPVRLQAEARVGRVLQSKWRLDSLIGFGGMAAVYAATHRNTKRVAVKILHEDVSTDEHVRERFMREGYAANRVGHPGAVDILDDDVDEHGAAFIVMELLDGENLDRRMRRKGGWLPVAEVLGIADQILDTLTAAHSRGILHRDIKPENVFLTRDGSVKLLDFGIARVLEVTPNAKVTQRGAVLGTPAFMPPEQAMAIWEEVDPRSDLWAVGATLFMLLTGEFVHPAVSGMQALDYAVHRRARSVGSVREGVHSTVVALVDRALAYERSERFQSAQEMQEAVRNAYAALEGDRKMPQLSLPDADDRRSQESLVTAPAPEYPAEEEPYSLAAKTMVSKRRQRSRAIRNVAMAVGGGLAVLVGATLIGRTRAPAPPAAVSAALAPGPSTQVATTAPPRAPEPQKTASFAPAVAISSLPPEPSAPASATAAPGVRPRRAASNVGNVEMQRPPVAAEPTTPMAPVAPPPPPATAEKPAEPADPFSGRF